MAHFYGWVSTASRLELLRGGSLLYHYVPRNFWYSFYRLRKYEMLSHPVVLNTGPLDWESSTLTNRPLLHKLLHMLSMVCYILYYCNNLNNQNIKLINNTCNVQNPFSVKNIITSLNKCHNLKYLWGDSEIKNQTFLRRNEEFWEKKQNGENWRVLRGRGNPDF